MNYYYPFFVFFYLFELAGDDGRVSLMLDECATGVAVASFSSCAHARRGQDLAALAS